MAFHVPEKFRFSGGPLGTDASHGNNGLFFIRVAHGQTLRAIASDGGGWEHVSVSRSDRCPTWEEMCQVKALFWDGDDCVVQTRPNASGLEIAAYLAGGPLGILTAMSLHPRMVAWYRRGEA